MNILILYSTREGHTQKVCEFAAEVVARHGHRANVVDARVARTALEVAPYGAVIAAGSIHMGHYDENFVRLLKNNATALATRPVLLLTVCLAEATAEDEHVAPEIRAKSEEEIRAAQQHLAEETGFVATESHAIAGELAYTRYNFILRFVMKRIASQHGLSTDTKQDHDYTNWPALDAMVGRFVDARPS